MTDHRSELLVGVKQNPDGSLDLSHAATMGIELRISDPVVDRLRGPLVIALERENKYQRFQAEIVKKSEDGELQRWLVSSLNGIKKEDTPEITQKDIASLTLVTDAQEIQDLRDQYGYDFARPYFQLSLADYKTVYRKLTGRNDSNGCLLSGGGLNQDPLTDGIGITLAPSLGPDIIHELGHTIDPNINNRPKPDQVLEEFATYYRETYVPRIYTQSTSEKRADGGYTEPVVTQREVFETLKRIGATLTGEMYSDKYSSSFKSIGAYQERVALFISIIEQLESYMEKREINKAIYNAVSLSELSHLLSAVKRENHQ